jgi:hypothetical protein
VNERLKRTRRGTWKWRLPEHERNVLLSLADQLRSLLTHGADDPDLRRLFPSAYADDAEADAFYRLMAHDELLATRLTGIDEFEVAVTATELTEAQLMALMGTVNDLRLVLGTKLDVSENDDPSEVADDHPSAPAYALYWFLGYLLELIVEALSAAQPEHGTA